MFKGDVTLRNIHTAEMKRNCKSNTFKIEIPYKSMLYFLQQPIFPTHSSVMHFVYQNTITLACSSNSQLQHSQWSTNKIIDDLRQCWRRTCGQIIRGSSPSYNEPKLPF